MTKKATELIKTLNEAAIPQITLSWRESIANAFVGNKITAYVALQVSRARIVAEQTNIRFQRSSATAIYVIKSGYYFIGIEYVCFVADNQKVEDLGHVLRFYLMRKSEKDDYVFSKPKINKRATKRQASGSSKIEE